MQKRDFWDNDMISLLLKAPSRNRNHDGAYIFSFSELGLRRAPFFWVLDE